MLIQTSDPYARFCRLLGTRPQVMLHGDDLPNTTTFSAWQGRRGSVNGVGVGSPLAAKSGWGGKGCAGLKCAHFTPAGGQYVTFNAEAANYGASTAFTWVLASRIRSTAAQRNVLMLGAAAANNWRGLYISNTSDQFGMISNRSGSAEGDTGTTGLCDVQSIVLVSLSAGGALFIRQLTTEGESTLINTSHTMTGTLAADRFSLGTAILAGASSSPVAMHTRFLACARGVAVDGATASQVLQHVRDRMGCPLPASELANPLISIPASASLIKWSNAKMQTATLPTVNDLSGNGDMTSSGVVLTDQEFDFQDDPAASISGALPVIPAGTSPFTLIASVKRVAGRTWDSAANLNFISSAAPALQVTTLMSGGLFKYHYNGTLYSSGVNILSNWAAGQRHTVALVFDGSTLRAYIDNAFAPVATHTGVGARAQAAALHLGSFTGGAGGWEHKARDFAVYTAALSSIQLDQHFRAAAASGYNIMLTGDSNIARVGKDFYAPCGEVGIDYQCRRYVFPRAGLRTTFFNDGQSGSMWDTAGAIAPSSMIARGAAMDATLNANQWNIVVANCGTNDVHQSLYPGSEVSTILAKQTQWANERRASGKYRAIGAFQLPPSENSTFNTRLAQVNAGMLTLRDSGILDFVVTRPADMGNPLDGIHFLPKANTNDAEHWNGYGAKRMAQQLLYAILNDVNFHD
jgi:hypothetical protein